MQTQGVPLIMRERHCGAVGFGLMQGTVRTCGFLILLVIVHGQVSATAALATAKLQINQSKVNLQINQRSSKLCTVKLRINQSSSSKLCTAKSLPPPPSPPPSYKSIRAGSSYESIRAAATALEIRASCESNFARPSCESIRAAAAANRNRTNG
jgi:hypothetical protein